MTAPSPTRRRWTSEEERKLEELLDAGKEAAEIAVTLNRTPQAIYARLQRTYRKRSRLSALARSKGKST
jgi:IS30 family transposase